MKLDRRVWQVGTGGDARPYAEWMLENDVVAIGSGWAGPWPSEEYGPAHELRRFAEYAQAGDLVIAKHGKRLAMGIGVLGPYEFDEDQDDIEGWDLCHIRRVRWLSKSEHRFKRLALSQGRFSGCNDRDVLAWVARTIATADLRPPDRRSFEHYRASGHGSTPVSCRPTFVGSSSRREPCLRTGGAELSAISALPRPS